ncbi:MAG: TIGR03032 family protein [Actinomycetota bacterium]
MDPLERPIFIVAPPQSGAPLLLETLARSPNVWTTGDAGEATLDGLPELHPAKRGWGSNRLTADDADPAIAEALRKGLIAAFDERDGDRPSDEAKPLRLLDRTAKSSLRVPFLDALFPDATFIYLYRDPVDSLLSMLEAWESGAFVTYPKLPDWSGKPWSMVLVPGWRELAGKRLPEIVLEQWVRTSRALLNDLEALPPERWCMLHLPALVERPKQEINRLSEFLGIEWEGHISAPLGTDEHVVMPTPRTRKKHGPKLERILPQVKPVVERARDYLAEPAKGRRGANLQSPRESPLRSVYTQNVPNILQQLSGSLLVSTYQTGKLICIRRDDKMINTHFRDFQRPMGLTVHGDRLALGTQSEVWDYRNVPDAAPKIEPQGKHDACFVPRNRHYTGDIAIHEVAFAEGRLWIVATSFSCLATLDAHHSFIPRWRPDFITALSPEDRCHLNGLCVVDDKVRYVTALGRTNSAGGWRENKARGGILMEVPSSEIVASGLSMPHSPRWYDGRLWVLESGEGSICTVDLDTGEVETVNQLPGFTRGLVFAGPLAFVGLSQIRESSTFGGLPLAERVEERLCGVWLVNIESGETAGFIRFEDLVQEVFDIAILPGARYPEIAQDGSEPVNYSFVLPPEALAEVEPPKPQQRRQQGQPKPE